MSRVIAVGGAGKLRQKMSTRAAVMRATSMRDGAFSRRLMVGWEHRSRPLSGARPTASLNKGSPRTRLESGEPLVSLSALVELHYFLIESGFRKHSRQNMSRSREDTDENPSPDIPAVE